MIACIKLTKAERKNHVWARSFAMMKTENESKRMKNGVMRELLPAETDKHMCFHQYEKEDFMLIFYNPWHIECVFRHKCRSPSHNEATKRTIRNELWRHFYANSSGLRTYFKFSTEKCTNFHSLRFNILLLAKIIEKSIIKKSAEVFSAMFSVVISN